MDDVLLMRMMNQISIQIDKNLVQFTSKVYRHQPEPPTPRFSASNSSQSHPAPSEESSGSSRNVPARCLGPASRWLEWRRPERR